MDIQVMLDTIHAEIKEYGFSKSHDMDLKDYEVLSFHLHRMYGYVPYMETQAIIDNEVHVQFTTVADEVIKTQADMPAHSLEFAQRPAGHVDDILDAIGYGVQHEACRSAMPSATQNLGISLLKIHPDDEELRKANSCATKNTNKSIVSRTSNNLWCRRGQFSVKTSAVTAISPATDKSFTVFLGRAHLTMRFQSDKAAKAARHSLVTAVNTGRREEP